MERSEIEVLMLEAFRIGARLVEEMPKRTERLSNKELDNEAKFCIATLLREQDSIIPLTLESVLPPFDELVRRSRRSAEWRGAALLVLSHK